MNNVDCGIVEADVNNVYSQSLRYTPLTNLRVDWSWMSQNFHQLRGNGPYLVKPEGARRSHGVGLPTTFPTIVPYSLLADNTEDVLASNDPYAISLHALYMTFFCPLEFYTALPPDVLRMPLFAPLHASIKRVLKLRGDDAITNTTDECSKYMYPHNAHAIQEHVRAAIPIVNAYYTDVTAPAPKKERVALTAIPERFWEPQPTLELTLTVLASIRTLIGHRFSFGDLKEIRKKKLSPDDIDHTIKSRKATVEEQMAALRRIVEHGGNNERSFLHANMLYMRYYMRLREQGVNFSLRGKNMGLLSTSRLVS